MPLPNLLAPGLRVAFAGTSVGERSAAVGHYYAGRGNQFWQLLDATGLTDHAGLTSDRDHELLARGLGFTDVVRTRAASSNRELAAADYGVAGFIARIEQFAPAIVAVHDTEALRRVARLLGARPTKPPVGPVAWEIAGAMVYRLPSPSGTNTHMTYAEKAAAWRAFGDWVGAS